MAIQEGYDFLTEMFQNTLVFNLEWLVATIVIIITLVLISRITSNWKILAYPVTIMWDIAGLKPNMLIYIITAILFVINALSLETIGSVLGKFTKSTGSALRDVGKATPFDRVISNRRKRTFFKEIRKIKDTDVLTRFSNEQKRKINELLRK